MPQSQTSVTAPASPIRLANFNTFNPKTSLHFADTYVFRGTAPAQRAYGELYVIVQIDHATRTSPQVGDAIATILQYEYYRGNPSDASKNLEDALHKTNEILSDLAARGEIHWIGKLHGVIAVFQKDAIHVSASGRGKAYLVRDNDIAEISAGLYDASKAASPMKSFEHLASGELKEGDSVLLATPGITDYMTPEHLRSILQRSTPEQAIAEIQQRVGRDPATAHSAIALRFSREQVKAAVAQPIASSKKSAAIAPVKVPQRSAPSYAPSMLQKQTPTFSAQEEMGRAATGRLASPAASQPKKPLVAFMTGLSGLSTKLKNTFKKKKAASVQGPASTQGSVSQAAASMDTPATPATGRRGKVWPALKMAFSRIPMKVKLFGGLAVLLVIVFVISLFIFTGTRQSQAEREAILGKLSQAKQLEEQAAAAIIFKDFTQAQTLLKQAETMLAEIPADETLTPEIDSLKGKIAEDFDKLSGSVKITDPTVLATLSDQPVGLAIIDGELVAWLANGDVNAVAVNSGEVATGDTIERALGEPVFGTVDEDRVVLVTDENAMIGFDENKVDELDVSNFKPKGLVAIEAYGSRLYALDAGSNKLLRHQRTVSGYSQGESWVLDETPLGNTVDLAIDGNVWLLEKTGALIKMLQGTREDFTLGPVVDPLVSPTRIVTGEDMAFIYILEPEKKRMLQFEKETGTFVKQYTSDKFDALRDMVVIEKGAKAYLLNGTSIFQIDLQS
jgi:hypothetical protein